MAQSILHSVTNSAASLGRRAGGLALQGLTHPRLAEASLTALPLGFLVMSSVLPVVKVILIAAVGLISALPFFDVLNGDARKSLSKLVFTIFLPAIIFVDLGESISLERLMEWWFIPVNVILASVLGCLLGMLVAWLTDCPPQYFRIVFVLTGIGNMGNMPLVLLSAVCSDSRNPFGGLMECNKKGTAYIGLGMWMAALIMWGVVYNILAPPEDWLPGYLRPPSEGPNIDHKFMNEPMIKYQAPHDSDSDSDNEREESVERAHSVPIQTSTPHPISQGAGNAYTPLADRDAVVLPRDEDPSYRGRLSDVGEEWSVRRGYMVNRQTGVVRRMSKSVQKASVAMLVHAPNKCGDVMRLLHIYDIFRPPVLAAFLAMVFGMIPPVAFIFFNENGPLRFFTDCLAVLGQAMIPCILLVLGANLVNGPGASGLPPRTTAGVVVARLVLVPMLGVFIVLTADRLGLLPPNDPMFRFVLLMQHAMPSSIQIGTACSLRGFGEKEVAAVLFFEHLSAIVSMGCCLFGFFYILYG